MKRTLLAIMMLCLSTTLMSCNSGNTDSKTESSAETTVETTETESNEAAPAKKIKRSEVKDWGEYSTDPTEIIIEDFDANGQKVKEQRIEYGFGRIGMQKFTTTYTFTNGKLAKITQKQCMIDGVETTDKEYDCEEETLATNTVKFDSKGNMVSNEYSTYKYDDKGLCISKDDVKYTYTFDANGQWKTRKGSDGSKAERTVTYW